jgi:hypothetical protein
MVDHQDCGDRANVKDGNQREACRAGDVMGEREDTPTATHVFERIAEQAEVRVEIPSPTVSGATEVRTFLDALLPQHTLDTVIIQENAKQEVASLTLRLSPECLLAGILAPPAEPDFTRPASTRQAEKSQWMSIPASVKLIGAGFLGFLTAVSTLLGILVLFFPDLRREPPANLGGIVAEVALEERQVMHDGVLSNAISYELELSGYRGKKGYIKYAIFDAMLRQQIDPPRTSDPSTPKFYSITEVMPEAATDRVSLQFFIPLPFEARCVFVRVYAFEDEAGSSSKRLDYADSEPFYTHRSNQAGCAEPGSGDAASNPAEGA